MTRGTGLMSMKSLVRHAAMTCVIVGDSSVGKSTMLQSYSYNRFPTDYAPSLSENVYSVMACLDNRAIQIALLDTSKKDERDRIAAYEESDVFVVCFSVDSTESMNNAANVWIPEIRKHAGKEANIILVGTKVDLRDNEETLRRLTVEGKTPIFYEDGVRLARKRKCLEYRECSALTQDGLADVFDCSLKYALQPQENKRPTGFNRFICWRTA